MIEEIWRDLQPRLSAVNQVRLFLDYDGTLADFAPAPDVIQSDPALLELLSRLANHGKYQLALVSGRSLPHLKQLLPMHGLVLAGTYGLEMELPDGTLLTYADYSQIRPVMEQLLPHWQMLLEGQVGFFLEDKGWSLAMHARFATEPDAQRVLGKARDVVDRFNPDSNFMIERRERFLEIAPREANKSRAVAVILERLTSTDALPLFFGDDMHDENAFEVILAKGGRCLRIAPPSTPTRAQYRLEKPAQVRQLLEHMVDLK